MEVVLKVEIHGERDKQTAMKAVSTLSGIEYLGIDEKRTQITVIGDVDPLRVLGKLKKWAPKIETAGTPKEPEKKKEDDVTKNDDRDQCSSVGYKMVWNVEVYDEKEKRKAMKSVARLAGIEYLAMDLMEKELTLIGDVDPLLVAEKLKYWYPKLATLGPPAKPEKKKEDDNNSFIYQKKMVWSVELRGEGEKRKAMKAVSKLSGIDYLAMDMVKKELTVIGNVDPVRVSDKLKYWHPKLATLGPAEEPEKETEDEPKTDDKNDQYYFYYPEDCPYDLQCPQGYPYVPYYPQDYTKYYHLSSAEENPKSCVIC
ncbi:hypothetical protein OROGR_012967 [Orobanche gracilis]